MWYKISSIAANNVVLVDCLDEALPGNMVDGEVEKKTETVKA